MNSVSNNLISIKVINFPTKNNSHKLLPYPNKTNCGLLKTLWVRVAMQSQLISLWWWCVRLSMGIFTRIFIFLFNDFGLKSVIALTFSQKVNLPCCYKITPPCKTLLPTPKQSFAVICGNLVMDVTSLRKKLGTHS